MSKQRVQIPEFKPEETPLSCTWIVIGAPASGKCLSTGQNILLFSGEVIKAGDVKIGECYYGR